MLRRIATAMLLVLAAGSVSAQYIEEGAITHTLFDIPPRRLVNMPTAGTLPRASFDVGVRLYPRGGGLGFVDIGISNRFQLGMSFGGDGVISVEEPVWNDNVGINVKFRFIDEMEYFPAVSVGYTSQGYGTYSEKFKRYRFKSRGFYIVASRSFYFYKWTSGWHGGINLSREDEIDKDDEVNFFVGFDATFNYNVALLIEWDAALNDDRSTLPSGEANHFGGRGRGYLDMSVKWLFTENLELEFMMTDLLENRKDSETFGRELRMTYIERF